uniref:Uncharacterized protein n=1 Tax=Arundo donax TaxID=35708 RepID=A0A0A8Y114_ARUDO
MFLFPVVQKTRNWSGVSEQLARTAIQAKEQTCSDFSSFLPPSPVSRSSPHRERREKERINPANGGNKNRLQEKEAEMVGRTRPNSERERSVEWVEKNMKNGWRKICQEERRGRGRERQQGGGWGWC